MPRGYITPNFTWAELTRGSDHRAFRGDIYDNLLRLSEQVLQPVRDTFGAPIHVTSGWRDPIKNAAVGGHPNSSHMHGRAADFTVSGGDDALRAVWKVLLDSDTPFDKAALYLHRGFIHVNVSKDASTEPRRLAYDVDPQSGRWSNRRHVPISPKE